LGEKHSSPLIERGEKERFYLCSNERYGRESEIGRLGKEGEGKRDANSGRRDTKRREREREKTKERRTDCREEGSNGKRRKENRKEEE